MKWPKPLENSLCIREEPLLKKFTGITQRQIVVYLENPVIGKGENIGVSAFSGSLSSKAFSALLKIQGILNISRVKQNEKS